jgi:predicted RNase H-like HicB family nuclease
LALDYPVEVTKDEHGFFARVPDLPGCESSGDTLEGAFDSIGEARELWIRAALETRDSLPLPRGENDYSGKFVVRVGPSVHRDLARIAAAEGVSLNALVSSVLARETGRFAATSGTPIAALRPGGAAAPPKRARPKGRVSR